MLRVVEVQPGDSDEKRIVLRRGVDPTSEGWKAIVHMLNALEAARNGDTERRAAFQRELQRMRRVLARPILKVVVELIPPGRP